MDTDYDYFKVRENKVIEIIYTDKKTEALIYDFILNFVYILLFIILLTVILVYLFGLSITNPLTKITKTVSGIKNFSQSDLNSLEPFLYRQDELGLLAKAFKSMVYELSHLYAIKDNQLIIETNQKKEKEEELNTLASILESSDDALIGISLKGEIMTWNIGAKKTFGFKNEEIINKSFSVLVPVDEIDEMPQMIEHIKKGDPIIQYDAIRKRKDGHLINVSMTISPIKNSKGEIIAASASIRNITKQKKILEEMARLDRLNTIGQTAMSIAHEIRNPMTTVRGFLQFFLKKEEFIPYSDHFRLMVSELDRANSIISEFLSFSQHNPEEFEEINLNKIIETIYPLMLSDAKIIQHHIELNLAPVPSFMLNEKEIRQILLNLVRNGLEAMTQENGTLRIHTFLEDEKVVLLIEDEGPGIDPAILSRLGSPFFTTKNNGTGLGLAVCYNIISRYKATMHIDTNSSGTKIYIKFPTTYSAN
jgi:PAS domain S-box-containing protein